MTTGASNDRNQSSPLLFVIEAVFVIASVAPQSSNLRMQHSPERQAEVERHWRIDTRNETVSLIERLGFFIFCVHQ